MSEARVPELLAPAGGPDAAYAAFHYGADAVYCGLPRFSARADAENFTLEELGAVTAFAHAQTPRRRVYAAVNTLVLQAELPAVIEALAALADMGVDALIVQDLGVAQLAREYFPELRLHASTQLAIHSRAGAAAARSFGFARVTLARELTLDEIRESAARPGLEVETFIHGALCYSYSGLCLFSSQLLGRSGNRGRCAQPCRTFYTVGTGADLAGRTGFACSMKDLALPDYAAALRDAGVSSFKIEGRKKSALYVAAVTRFYRGVLDGAFSETERAACAADIQTIFSRPWTRLFVQSRREQAGADVQGSSHRGTPIGSVEGVTRGAAGGSWLRFRTARALERRDGLQVEIPGAGSPFGFAVEELRIVEEASATKRGPKGRRTCEAPAGSRVEVRLPEGGFPPLPAGATVCCSSSQEVKRRYRFPKPKPGQFRARRVVDARVVVTGSCIRATGRAAARGPGEEDVEASSVVGGAFGPAREAREQESVARKAFQQLGDTRLALGQFAFHNPEARFVPLSQWKALRRAWAVAMEAALDEAQARRVRRVVSDAAEGLSTAVFRAGEGAEGAAPREAFLWSLKVDRVALLAVLTNEDWGGLEEVVIEVARDPLASLSTRTAELAKRVGRERIRLALPVITRAWEREDIESKVVALRAAGWRKWEASNLSAWETLGLGRAHDLDVSAGWPVYVLNLVAARSLFERGISRVTLSVEDGLENYRALLAALGLRATLIVYQDTPLFQSETCAYASLRGGCAGPSRCSQPGLPLVSGFGDRLLAVTERCRTVVVNAQPFCLAARWRELRDAGAVRVRADFMYRPYAAAEVRSLWRLVRSGHAPAESHVGNFDRGLL